MNSSYIKILFSSSLGTALEWYDFSLFAYLTPTLATLFFPKESSSAAVLFTYAIFALGFIVRPLGAILFGHIGDRYGRKKALMLTILLMSISTSLIGFLPTYSTLGIYAPFILVFLRICQGLSVGGETTGAVLFALESSPNATKKNHGFWSALLWSITGIGLLLGLFSANLVMHSQLSWAWRIPFLIGIVTGIMGYFLRKQTNESLLFEKILKERKMTTIPLFESIKQHKTSLLNISALYILSAMITYIIFIYLQNYTATVTSLSKLTISKISTLSLLAVTLLLPLGGLLSDKIGTKKCLLYSSLGFMLFSYPLFLLITHGTIAGLIIAECIFVFFAVFYQGALTQAAYNMAPINIRYSLLALGYNLSYSLFGGTAPLVATYLVHATGNLAAPGIYLTCGAVIAFVVCIVMSV